MKLKLGDVRPNPFRDLDAYPIDPETLNDLVQSMGRTGYWDNVVVRERDGVYEQAHGHHRVAAALTIWGPDHEVDFIVRDFDDEQMFTSMVDENARDKRADAALDQQAVAGLLRGYAAGRLHLDPPSDRAPEARVRYVERAGVQHPYTMSTVRKRLGWGVERVQYALSALDLMAEHDLPADTFSGVSSHAAHDVIVAARRARARQAPPAAVRQVIRESVHELRNRKGNVVSQKVAAEVVDRIAPPPARELPPPDRVVETVEKRIRALLFTPVAPDRPQTVEQFIQFIAAHKDDERFMWPYTRKPFAETLADALEQLSKDTTALLEALR